MFAASNPCVVRQSLFLCMIVTLRHITLVLFSPWKLYEMYLFTFALCRKPPQPRTFHTSKQLVHPECSFLSCISSTDFHKTSAQQNTHCEQGKNVCCGLLSWRSRHNQLPLLSQEVSSYNALDKRESLSTSNFYLSLKTKLLSWSNCMKINKRLHSLKRPLNMAC